MTLTFALVALQFLVVQEMCTAKASYTPELRCPAFSSQIAPLAAWALDLQCIHES